MGSRISVGEFVQAQCGSGRAPDPSSSEGESVEFGLPCPLTGAWVPAPKVSISPHKPAGWPEELHVVDGKQFPPV